MRFSAFYHPQVYYQLVEIVDWYEEKQKGLGEEFVFELDKSVSLIVKNPLAFAKRLKQSRQVKLNKFPYVLIYEIHGNVIEIYNIIHASRHPIRRVIKK